jgi:iron complex outermembrane receptor protein
LGGRYDRYRFAATDRFRDDGVDDSGGRVMDEISPMLGLTYRPSARLSFYMNFATAFQTPTTTELSNQPAREGGFNPDLQPETIRSYELGVKGLPPGNRFDWDIAVYVLEVAQMLIPYQIQNPNSEEIFFRNAGKARNQGIEANFQWRPVDGLRTAFAYTFMDFAFKDFLLATSSNARVQLAGKEVPGVPPHHLFAGLSYEHPRGIYSEINFQWLARYFANDFNGPAPGSDAPAQNFINAAYRTADIRLGLQGHFKKIGIDFFLGVNNVFDTRYNGSIVPNAQSDRFFEPAPGRSWYVGINLAHPYIYLFKS